MADEREGLQAEIGITLDRLTRQLGAAEARMVKTAKRFEREWQKSNGAVERSFDGVKRGAEGSAQAMISELDRLRAKYDPAFASAQRFKGEIEEVDRALKVGAITSGQHVAAVERIRAKYQQTENAAQDVSAATRVLGASAREAAGGRGLMMMSMQLSQVAQQGAATGQWMRAFGMQSADMLLFLGPIPALIGAATAALTPMAAELLASSDGMEKLIDKLIGGQVSLDSARGSIEQLRDLQKQYTDAIEATARASGGAAEAVVANTRREFEARKQMLQVERELLRLRSADMQAQYEALQSDVREQVRNKSERTTLGIAGGIPPEFATSQSRGRPLKDYVNVGPRKMTDVFTPGYLKQRLALKELEAQLKLTELAAEEAGTALETEFKDVGSGVQGWKEKLEEQRKAEADAVRDAEKAGKRATSETQKAIKADAKEASKFYAETLDAMEKYRLEVQRIRDLHANGSFGEGAEGALRAARALDEARNRVLETSQAYTTLRDSSVDAFTQMITGAESAQDALSGLFSMLGTMLVNQGGRSLWDSFLAPMFPVPNARGNAFSGGKITPFARGGVVSGPTMFPMAKGVGLMGEAGPEAIMPLRRGRDGKLGVASSGGGSGGQVTVRVEVGENGSIIPVVERTAGNVSAYAIKNYDRTLPARFAKIRSDDRARRG